MNQIIFNILYSFSIIALLALSFNVIFITSKFLNLAHAVIITFAGYFCYFFYTQQGISFWIAIILGIVISVLISLIIELSIYRPLRKKNTASTLMLITSLGLYIVLQNCISILWGDDTKTIKISDITPGNVLAGVHYTKIQITTILLNISLFVFTVLFLQFHKIGRNMRAISANLKLANIHGINSNHTILWSYIIGSVLASIVGIFISIDTGITPVVGFNLLLYGIIAMVIGGIGSKWGLLGGALLLASALHLGAYYIDSKWMDAIAFTILIVFLIWKPLGFSGNQLKKIEI